MKYYMQTILKQNLWPLLICIAFVALNLIGLAQFDTFATFLLAFIIYDYNVGEKVRGTWRYFHSLPISLNEKFLIKVICPLVFYFLITLGMSDSWDLFSLFKGEYLDILISGSILILASILANNLKQFILYILGLAVVGQIIENIPYGEFSALTIFILGAYYYLSEKRADYKKLVSVGIISILLPLITWQLSSPVINKSLLNTNDMKLGLFAAKNLLVNGHDQDAVDKIQTIIINQNNIQLQKQALSFSLNNDIDLNIDAETWMELFENRKSLRRVLLNNIDEFIENEVLDQQDLTQIENIVLESQLEDHIEILAEYVSESMTEAHHQRIQKYLRMKDPTQVYYALEVISMGQLTGYKSELLDLINSPNIDNRDRAIRIILGQTKSEFRNELDHALDKFNEDDNNQNRAELIKLLRGE